MASQRDLASAARRTARALAASGLRLVLAESCTGGLVSAALTHVPGISAYHCGSAVVYRVGTKAAWLGVPPALLKRPGPVSRAVALRMAEGVLERTPEADLAGAVTGHLGPEAPPSQDGLVYVAVAFRASGTAVRQPSVTRHWLSAGRGGKVSTPSALRRNRQREAACLVLQALAGALEPPGTSRP